LIHPFYAAYYSADNRAQLSELALADLDTAEHLWGGPDNTRAFRNVLVGPPERRGEIWQSWISGGGIELSEEPLYYVLHHRQMIGKRQIDRWGFYAAIDVHEPGLFIHEDVFPEGVERARQAAEACESDMAPIFVGCEEKMGDGLRKLLRGATRGKPSLMHFQESKTTQHRIWPIQDPAVAKKLQEMFTGTPLFLLDGHHRLEAARENHRLGMGDGRLLVCICSMAASDTLILPIHRAVHYERWMLADMMTGDLVRAGCQLQELPELKVSKIPEFLEKHKQDTPFCVTLHSYADVPTLVTMPRVAGQAAALSALSVVNFDFGVLTEHQGCTSIPVPSHEMALRQLAVDQAQAAFFLPPATPRQVREIALAKLKMPRKSTRFMPKPALGLLCRPWMASG
jgi:hypothetical protein